MNDPISKIRLAVACFVWLFLLGLGVAIYHFWWSPTQQRLAEEKVELEKKQIIEKTSSASRYQHTVRMAIDSFSGYAILRSQTFKDECARHGILVELADDGADYRARYQGLVNDDYDMAVFTLDALLKVGDGQFPASAVCVLDESRGADAVVAAGKRFPNVDALNDPEVRFVCVGNSPSETLARVVLGHFRLDRLPENPFEYTDRIEDVYNRYKQAASGDKRAYVLWEPYVSRVAENPDYHVLIDSGKFRGYVVDVLLARRGFLARNETVAEAVVKAYLASVFARRNDMVGLVLEDSKIVGEPLKQVQAEQLVKTVWWKNTQENYGHFGLTPGSLQHLDEMIRNIGSVLVTTGAVSADPTRGKPNELYYDGIIRRLFDSGWHPGFGEESVRQERKLVALTEQEWSQLRPVGTLQVPRLVFARGTAAISSASEATLAGLAEKLKSFPNYYLIVRGNASSDGDVQANLTLAAARAQAAVRWLIEHGVDHNRIRAESAKPNGSTTVAFLLGETSY